MGSCMSGQVDFDGEVNLYHFDLHKAVGRGAFGKVRVVEHKRTKKLYALKYIDKARCIRQKAVANIIQERRLLEEIDHPFVVNMRYAFQDDENCFFVLDLMLGGDLRFHLERKGPFPEEVVRFWVAELSQALEYLHRQRIMHRDIKPDNILLDAAGHAHFTDFNIAIHYSEKRMHTSVAGSMAYMAPEVVDSTGALAGGRKGYTWCVDWWSLGVTAYELLFQRRPFDGRTAEKMKSSILRDPIRFPILDGGMVGVSRRDAPPNVVSQEGASALRQFLERDPKKRLGCRPHGQGISDIEQHPWFRSIDWDQVNNKALTPPFTPDQKKPNFDVTHELDEFLMVEKPLTHTKRKANPDLEKMKPELRQMEEQFTVYDFTSTQRMSYYPHNEPITAAKSRPSRSPSAGHSSSGHSRHNSQDSTTARDMTATASETLVPTATIIDRSLAGTPVPMPLNQGLQRHPPPLPAEMRIHA